MLQRPSLGEVVVFSSATSAEVFFVKALSHRFKDQVGLFNLSVPLKPIMWCNIKRLSYLSQAQAMAFYRTE